MGRVAVFVLVSGYSSTSPWNRVQTFWTRVSGSKKTSPSWRKWQESVVVYQDSEEMITWIRVLDSFVSGYSGLGSFNLDRKSPYHFSLFTNWWSVALRSYQRFIPRCLKDRNYHCWHCGDPVQGWWQVVVGGKFLQH